MVYPVSPGAHPSRDGPTLKLILHGRLFFFKGWALRAHPERGPIEAMCSPATLPHLAEGSPRSPERGPFEARRLRKTATAPRRAVLSALTPSGGGGAPAPLKRPQVFCFSQILPGTPSPRSTWTRGTH